MTHFFYNRPGHEVTKVNEHRIDNFTTDHALRDIHQSYVLLCVVSRVCVLWRDGFFSKTFDV